MSNKLMIYTSSQVQQIAEELADDYVNLLDVDIRQEEKQLEDSIEECLAHLEEVCSVTDSYKQHHSENIDRLDQILTQKSVPLTKFCEQLDRLEQFMFETSRLLDQLDECMKCLESRNKPKGGAMSQIIGLLPRFSRFRILENVGVLAEDNESSSPSNSNDSNKTSQTTEELLIKVDEICSSLCSVINDLNDKSHCNATLDLNYIKDDLTVVRDRDEHQVDGSWQELL